MGAKIECAFKNMIKKNKHDYGLRAGMVIERNFYGRIYKLFVIDGDEGLKFKLDERIFDSLTAAARHVLRDETRPISGPQFWGLLTAKRK
jgi:hypothetical protein